MIWKHSCKSCLRMGWKAALFALLTAMATMFLYLSGNTWLSSERMLRECDEAYTTIAVLEYIGDNYPGETEYDPDMQAAAAAFDYRSITGSEHVLSWEQTNLSVGSVEGMAAHSQQIPYRSGCVLVVENIRYVDGYDAYWGDIVAAPYSFTEEARGKHVFWISRWIMSIPSRKKKLLAGRCMRSQVILRSIPLIRKSAMSSQGNIPT